MAPAGFLSSFLAAVQASLSVLLVIFYGGLAAWLKMLDPGSTKGHVQGVRAHVPAGLALHADRVGAARGVGGIVRHRAAVGPRLPPGVVPGGHLRPLRAGHARLDHGGAHVQQHHSYPLLLIAALDQTGILQVLVGPHETTAAALERAKAYFLVFATISSCLTFAVGPRLIDSEHAPEPDDDDDDKAGPQPGGPGAGVADEDDEDDEDNSETGPQAAARVGAGAAAGQRGDGAAAAAAHGAVLGPLPAAGLVLPVGAQAVGLPAARAAGAAAARLHGARASAGAAGPARQVVAAAGLGLPQPAAAGRATGRRRGL